MKGAPRDRSRTGPADRAPLARITGPLIEHGLVLAGCLLTTLIMTYPLIRVFKAHVAGAGGDTYTFVWNLWWVRKALTEPGLSLFHTDYLYYPDGVSLAFHSLTLLNGLVSIPLQPLVGLVGAYNLLILSGFVFGAWGAYLLVREVTGRRGPALFAAFVFGFSPYHAANAMVDLNIASIQFIPLALYGVARWRRTRRDRDACLAGVLFALTGLSDWYYLVFTVFAAAVLLGTGWLAAGRPRPARAALRQGALAGAVALLLMAPVLWPLAREMVRGASFENPGEEKDYSADLAAYVTPSSFQPLFRDHVNPLYARMSGNIFENTVTPGFVVLLLGVMGTLGAHGSSRRGRDGSPRPERLPWIALALAAFVLSLGPVLQIAGRSLGSGGYLPYAWLVMKAPLLQHLRVPSRFAVLVSLALAVLAAFGLGDLLDFARARGLPRDAGAWSSTARRDSTLLAGAFLLATFELWPGRFPTTRIPVPAFFEAVGRDPGDYTILGLPTEEWAATVLAMDYQTVHGKRLVNGFVARLPAGTRERLAAWKRLPPDHALLVKDRVRFIVFFTNGGVLPWEARAMSTFDRIPWLHRIDVRDDSIVVYEVDWN